MPNSISLQLEPHLYNFLKIHLGVEMKRTIKNTSNIGCFILNRVEVSDFPLRGRPVEKNVLKLEIPTETSTYNLRSGGHPFLSEKGAQEINKLLEFIMKKELFDKLDLIEENQQNKQRNGKISAEIRKFVQKYSSAEVELSFDTWKKRYQRHKKKGLNLLFTDI